MGGSGGELGEQSGALWELSVPLPGSARDKTYPFIYVSGNPRLPTGWVQMNRVHSLVVVGALCLIVTSSLLVSFASAGADGKGGTSGGGSSGGSSSGGCPNANAIGNFLPTSIVGASFSSSGGTSTYFFNSLTNTNSTSGIPGLIQYCVYPTTLPLSATPTATGADGSAFTLSVGTHQGYFGFGRATGDPSNIPLSGQIGVKMGTASWSGSPPTNQSIVLHINDAAICQGLYGSGSTCFVWPAGSMNPVCGGAPACKTISSPQAISTNPLTIPNMTQVQLQFTFTIVNQPGNPYNMEFTPYNASTPAKDWTGVFDTFTCLELTDPNGTPASYGNYADYQGTGLNMLFSHTANATCSRPVVTLANLGSSAIVLAPGQSLTFTVDLQTQSMGLCEGNYIMNFGVVLHWFETDDSAIHTYHGPFVGITVA